jgi:ACT domain-containing protein
MPLKLTMIGVHIVQNKKNKLAVLKIEIDRDLYEKYKKVVKGKNQMLKGYNDNLFLKIVKDELKREKVD